MPTYHNPNSEVMVERGVKIGAGQDVSTPKVLTETYLSLANVAGNPEIGEKVTGQSSGATGYVLWLDISVMGLRDVVGTFENQETVAGETSGFSAAASANLWLQKTDESPYAEHVVKKHGLSSTGPGDDQTVHIDVRKTQALEVYNDSDADISVYLRASIVGEPYFVPANSIREINELNGEVDKFIMQFSTAGSCTVTELRR